MNPNQAKYLTVTAINRYLKDQFDRNEHLRTVFLKGEISNFKGHTTGHLYFSLKDENSKINAVMFSRNASKLLFKPADGMKVLVAGRISVYEQSGSYQIYVEEMQEDGVGNLYIAFEKLKQDLAKEGLFNPEHKKPIPKYPTRIGIVTAPTGAAIRDILSTIRRRYPLCETILFPSLVQGEYAAPDIVRNIKRASRYQLDVLIVGRGGGSIEDLWAFNEEIVARAIYESEVPIISAVGHEVDFTIADFVADRRAPTPTGAAEMAVPNVVELQKYLHQLEIRLEEAMIKKVRYQKLVLESLKNSFVVKSPMILFDNKKQALDLLHTRLEEGMQSYLGEKRILLEQYEKHYLLKNPRMLYEPKKEMLKHSVDNLARVISTLVDKQKVNLFHNIQKLELVNPLGVLKRGYSIPMQDEKVVRGIKSLKKDSLLQIRLVDGIVDTKIEKVKEIEYGKRDERKI